MEATNADAKSPARSSGGTRILVWTVLLAGGLYLFLVGGNLILVREVSARIVLHGLAFGILGVWLAGTIVRPSWRVSTRQSIPLALAVGALVMSALLSQRPRLSLEPTLGGLGFALLYLLLSRLLSDSWFRRRISTALVVVVSLIAVAYVAQVLAEWVSWWSLIGRIAVPPLRPAWASLFFSTPNNLAAVLLVAGPLAAVLLGLQTRYKGIVWLVSLAVVLAILLTGSRGAYFGAGVGLVVALGAVGLHLRAHTEAPSLAERFRSRPGLVVFVAMVVIAAAALFPVIAYRFAQGGDDVRLDLWRSAIQILLDHPLTGGGPGTWVQLKIEATPSDATNNIFSEAHSSYFQAAAELGIVGLAALAFLVIGFLGSLTTAWKAGGHLRLQATAVGVGLAALAAQSVVANLTSLPVIALLVVLVASWIDTALPTPAEPAGSPRMAGRVRAGRAIPAIGFVGLIAAAIATAVGDAAALEDTAGNDAAWNRDWSGALIHYEAARRLDPEFTLYKLRAASALARLGRLIEARVLLHESIQQDPIAVNQIGLAALDAELGDQDAALQGAATATDLIPINPTISLNAGLIGERAGELDFALDQYADAVAADPPLAGSEFWVSPDRRVSKDNVIELAIQRTDGSQGALVLAYAGRSGDALNSLRSLAPSRIRDTHIAAATWLGGDVEGARRQLVAILEADPLDWFAAAWLARISRLSGDAAGAERYGLWASMVQFDRARGVLPELSVVPAPIDQATAGLPQAYPSGTYLRETGPYLLMPQLTLIGWR